MTILDPNNPMASARRVVAEKFTVNGRRVLHCRDRIWMWDGRRVDREEITNVVWKFLGHAKCRNAKGELVDFRPTSAKVANVMTALAVVCNDDEVKPKQPA